METEDQQDRKEWKPLTDKLRFVGFQPLLAKEIGLNETIFLNHVHSWLQVSTNKYDGFLWVYKTYEQWREELPFWSADTIKRAIKKLEKNELIIIGNYNKKGYDNTKWYTINYTNLNELIDKITSMQNAQTDNANCYDDVSKMHRPSMQNAQTVNAESIDGQSKLPPQSEQIAQLGQGKMHKAIPINTHNNTSINTSFNNSNNTSKKETTNDNGFKDSFPAPSISNSVNSVTDEEKEKRVVGRSVSSNDESIKNQKEKQSSLSVVPSLSNDEKLNEVIKAYEFAIGPVDEKTLNELKPLLRMNKDYRLITEALRVIAQQDDNKNKSVYSIPAIIHEWKSKGINNFEQLQTKLQQKDNVEEVV